jgi:hypothetical protein
MFRQMKTLAMSAALAGALALGAANTSGAMPLGGNTAGLNGAGPDLTTQVRGGWFWGGLAVGVIGGAILWSCCVGPRYYYGPRRAYARGGRHRRGRHARHRRY